LQALELFEPKTAPLLKDVTQEGIAMIVDRRNLLLSAGPVLALGAPTASAEGRRIEAVAFDVFTIFDPRSVAVAAEAHVPGKGDALVALWRTRQFEYCWLRTLYGNYTDFWRVSEEALIFAGKSLKIELDDKTRAALMQALVEIALWPDSVAALRRMREAGLRLAYLSVMTPRMLEAISDRAQLADLFEFKLSADAVRAFKPDPRAYAMAERAFALPRARIAFAAFGGWDAAGAKSFGLETFWVNRLGAAREELGVAPDGEGRTLDDLAHYVLA
jgi:2-haloacid dehalogenase